MSKRTKGIILYTIIFAAFAFVGITVQAKLLPESFYSPGHLVQAHGEVVTGCQDCHSPWQKVSKVNCTTSNCHSSEKMATQIKSTSLLDYHKNNESKDCLSCHTEHQGEGAKISFNFDHQTLSAQQSCIECHVAPSDSKHTDYGDDCASCHGTAAWKPSTFNHDKVDKVDTRCLECHKGAVPQDHRDNSYGDDCAACHSTTAWKPSTFDHDKVDKVETRCLECHKGVVPKDHRDNGYGDDCASCHSTTAWEPSTFDHSKYFPLNREHNVSCVECHPGGNLKQYSCTSCHSESKMLREHRTTNYSEIANCMECHKGNGEGRKGRFEGRRENGFFRERERDDD